MSAISGRRNAAFTVVELLIVVGIILTLAAMAIPFLFRALEAARIARAVGDIRTLQTEIAAFEATNGRLPYALSELTRDTLVDPWGNPYQYLNFSQVKGKGQMRKDRFLVPINSTYDLYSMGPDGKSQPPLTAQSSHDDIVRANDGGFVGIASQY
jgi:general secretion pathway protein G